MRPSTTTVPPVMYSQQWSPARLDHGEGAGVADGEALADRAGDEELAAGGAVEAGVAGQHGALGPSRWSVGVVGGGRITMRPPPMPLPT